VPGKQIVVMIGIGRQWFRGDGGVGVVSAHLLTVLACLLVMCVQPAQPQRITTPRSTGNTLHLRRFIMHMLRSPTACRVLYRQTVTV